MDDIGLYIEKAVKRGCYRAAILLAVTGGRTALASILATCHERHLTVFDKVAIVTALAKDGQPSAFDLASRWYLRHSLPRDIREIIDAPRNDRRPHERTTENRRPPQPVRRAG